MGSEAASLLQASTFGIKGVEENAHFLLEVAHAQAIRSQLIYNITQAGLPERGMSEYNRLLHCVIIGGGPIGVEFAGELCDFINKVEPPPFALSLLLPKSSDISCSSGAVDLQRRRWLMQSLSVHGLDSRCCRT